MGRHRRRSRGLAYRLSRIIAVVTLIVWGGLLLSAMFHWNNSPPGDKEQLATRSKTVQEPVRVAEDNHGERRTRDWYTSRDPVEIRAPFVRADKRRMADDKAPVPPGSARDKLNFDEPADKAGGPAVSPPTARSDTDAESHMTEAQAARQSAAAEADATTESDMARFETAPEEPKAFTSASSNHVARAQFTTRIEAREPVDHIGAVFPSNGTPVRTLLYFTEITGLNGETVTHRWEHEGQVIAEVSFDIGSDRWRIYSSKNLSQAMQGDWRVVVTDSNGEIIKIDSFVYDDS
ncbi:MAG: DUF2914 domain-containing protein [Gammaproteobacteria bacterium]|nr:DUF2914 domain-containing protein [Gammaproteobacteria bacterium]